MNTYFLLKHLSAIGIAVAILASFSPLMQSSCFAGSFGADVTLLKKYTDVVVLSNKKGTAKIAVVPKYEGRVMTSTSGGDSGISYGWINPSLISSGKLQPHMNQFGGEDRLWLGPEGGQFGLFFAKGSKFDLSHWQVPAQVDSQPWKIVNQDAHNVSFEKSYVAVNYSGSKFSVKIDRTVTLLKKKEIAGYIGGDVPDTVQVVGYQSTNTLTNAGSTAFSPSKGLLSIWILGQYNAAANTTVVLPFKKGPTSSMGKIVNDTYFGKVPSDRLKVDNNASIIAFKADGRHRGKIGVNWRRATPNYGSYDATNHALTVIQYSSSKESPNFVNSMWEIQKSPYSGDELNSYNDGGAFGPFYEIESSSPAIALGPGASITHIHRTIHLMGAPGDLDPIAVRLFGVHLDQINAEFK